MMNPESTSIDIAPDSRAIVKGKAPLLKNADYGSRKATTIVLGNPNHKDGKFKKAISIFGLIVRISAIVSALAAAALMGTTEQTLPFFTQFFQFHAEYDDIPTFQFFVIAMAIVGGYLVLSIPISVITIIRPHAVGPTLLLFILDTVAVTLATAAASAAAAIDYLAHNGNSDANWLAICNQFGDFCQKASTAVVQAFIAVVGLVSLIGLSALALRKH